MPVKASAPLKYEVPWPRRIRTAAEAAKFIDALGFCVLYPVGNIPLASLYVAVTRRDPRKKMIWDRLSQLIWRWKDELPARRRACYAKYFRSRGTFISPRMLPHFLAMREAVVAPGDYDRLYAEGRIGGDARSLWESLAAHGPMATLELRHACRMETKAGNARFKRAIAELQCLLLVVHFGAEKETAAWASGRYELTCRAFPKQTAEARHISPAQAQAVLAAKYLQWYPQAPASQLMRLFRWSKTEVAEAIGSGGNVQP